MTRRRSARIGAIVAALAIAAVGCSYDFDVFNPTTLDGGVDSGLDAGDADLDAPPTLDAPSDVVVVGDGGDGAPACTAPVGCLTAAASCATICAQEEATCEAKVGCSLDPQCVPNCKAAETSCKQACVTTCTACTADGGCVDVAACTSAAK